MRLGILSLLLVISIIASYLLINEIKNNPLEEYNNRHASEKVSSVEEAIEIADKPARGFASFSPFELQTYYRIMWLWYRSEYRYKPEHETAWLKCMQDEKRSMYARLIGAHFLLDENNQEARDFMMMQLKSENLRHRYNAAEALRLHVGLDEKKEWGISVMIQLLKDGSIDGGQVQKTHPKEFPQGDKRDHRYTPIDKICHRLGQMKIKEAVPVLISVLERYEYLSGAVDALGDIGDERAVPILVKHLKNNGVEKSYRVISSLSQLKCKEMVPILLKYIDELKPVKKGMSTYNLEIVFEALVEVGDKRAVGVLKRHIERDFPKESKAVARRVLAQLDSDDPVKELILLFDKETYEPEMADILYALDNYKDKRVVSKLIDLSRQSKSAYIRRQAIYGLGQVGTREALLNIASLIDEKWPDNLIAEWGWKGRPDFQEYFPKQVLESLRDITEQDFGDDRKKWEEWIKENIL